MCDTKVKFELNDIVLSFEDFKQYASKQRGITSTIITGWRFLSLGYFLLLLFMFFTTKRVEGFKPTIDISFIMSIFYNVMMLLIFVVTPWVLYPIVLKVSLKKTYYRNKIDKVSNNYEFHHSGFRVTSKNGESRFNWEEIHGINRTPMHFRIHITKQQAFLIPSRYLMGNEEILKFIEQRYGESKTSVGAII